LTGVTGVIPDPVRARPVPAKSGVEDVVVVVEVGIRGAVVGGEEGDGCSPVSWVRLVIADVGWDLGSLEEPDFDSSFVPDHYKRSART